MPRQPILAFGLVALALTLGPAGAPRAAADEPVKKAGPDRGLIDKVVPHPAAEAEPGAMPPSQAEHMEEGHEGGNPNILKVEPSLAIWTAVVFIGLLLVLRRFAWKPLLAALHQREEHLEHVLLQTERARNESEQLLEEHRRQLAATEEQMRSMLETARREAQASGDEIVRRAQEEAEASQRRAERDISTAKDQALSEIWTKTADLAVNVAGKVLDRSLSEDDHRRLIDSAIGELHATANGHGHGGSSS
jgi:F-type H+-transporting ATPase subunit b